MANYPEFQKLIDTMKNAGYDEFEIDYKTKLLGNLKKREAGGTFTLQEHIRAMVYSMLSAQQDWSLIASKQKEIDKLFQNFDPMYVKNEKADVFIEGIKNLRCGNQQIKSQMKALSYNIDMLETIDKLPGGLDNYYNSKMVDAQSRLELLTELGRGKYKLQMMDIPLVAEYLKSVGVNLVKPDRHLCRILCRLGYVNFDPDSNDTTAKQIAVLQKCREIAIDYNVYDPYVDAVLWHYCAKNGFNECRKNQECKRCLVTNCKYRK